MPRETMRVRDVDGRFVEVDPAEVCELPVQRFALKKPMGERIARVYESLRDVLTAANRQPLSLEQFEFAFMRSLSPADELRLWESIALALNKALSFYPPEEYERSMLYERLILGLAGALTDEEMREETTKIIFRCLKSSYPPTAPGLTPASTAIATTMTRTVAGLCIVCYNRTDRAGAVFCPRCGRRLPIARSALKGK